MNLYLIGYRGTGKTTVGKLLAARLGWNCVDTDDLIEKNSGQSIVEIFASAGEPAFRDLETAAVAEVSQLTHTVVALGGGAILRPENRGAIAGTGAVVYLQASAQSIYQRVSQDASTAARRPNLTTGGLEEIESLLKTRLPLYESTADHTVNTEGKTPEQVASEILAFFP